MSFEYNSSGLRTKKVVGDKTTEYYYSGDLLVAQYDGTNWVKFVYAPNGEVIGFSIHDDSGYYDYCYYLKNVQGDIVGIYSMIFAIFRQYTYDAWGNITGVFNENGNPVTNLNDVAYYNPFRYRGYYYDDETGLYYLNSRYYNPEWGTFISADGYVSTGEQIVAKNMYAYCLNNPVNYADPSGLVCICAVERVGGNNHVCKDIDFKFVRNTPNLKSNPIVSSSLITKYSNSQSVSSDSSFFSGFTNEFTKNSLTAIADDTFGDVGSSSIGVASSFFLVVTLVEDYSNYREEPVKMIVAMLITVSGTAVSVAGAGAIAAIPGVGPDSTGDGSLC